MRITNQRGIELFVDETTIHPEAANVIFCCTPAVSVTELEKCYSPFKEYGFNTFAFDFAGTGKSGGSPSDFTIKGIGDDFDSLIKYIKEFSAGRIYLFADAGIGGIIGQHYVSGKTEIAGFAQFAVGRYRDLSSFGIPSVIARMCLPFVKLIRKIASHSMFNMKPPKYNGYHANLDNSFYLSQLEKNANFFQVSVHFICVLLEIFVGKTSQIKSSVSIPTLVFKTTHDRYFSAEYFDKYFESLCCVKKLHTVEDVHNSYILYPDKFAQAVSNWFTTLEKQS